MADRTLSRDEVRAVYDRIGAWQDTQRFYEAPAFDELIAHADFQGATSILEVGCGTGRLAERILRAHAPSEVRYEAVDLSATMVALARERLDSFGDRATVAQTDGALTFDRPDGSYDRILATYLLDLLSRDDAQTLLAESHRLLVPDGRLCLAGLTWGTTPLSKLATVLWSAVHTLRPRWVGGCRPLRVRPLLHGEQWRVSYHTVVTAWGVPSEVLIAIPA